ncbi:MAG TPA: DUF2939 domain-containing protein [Asticcacaulis sp.]|nr:DUF2939 domain-containing protein [Asticcacaulis sp.]
MSRALGLIILLAVAAAAAFFYFSPVIALYDIRGAAQTQDVDSLAKLIDFDAVRTSLKQQLDAGNGDVAAPDPKDPVAATGNVIKKATDSIGQVWNNIVNPTTAPKAPLAILVTPDDYLKPRAIYALTYGAGRAAPKVQVGDKDEKPMPQMVFFSLDRARVTVMSKQYDQGTTTFTFERKGLTHWVLVHIALPKPEEAGALHRAAAADTASESAAASPAQ